MTGPKWGWTDIVMHQLVLGQKSLLMAQGVAYALDHHDIRGYGFSVEHSLSREGISDFPLQFFARGDCEVGPNCSEQSQVPSPSKVPDSSPLFQLQDFGLRQAPP